MNVAVETSPLAILRSNDSVTTNECSVSILFLLLRIDWLFCFVGMVMEF